MIGPIIRFILEKIITNPLGTSIPFWTTDITTITCDDTTNTIDQLTI